MSLITGVLQEEKQMASSVSYQHNDLVYTFAKHICECLLDQNQMHCQVLGNLSSE